MLLSENFQLKEDILTILLSVTSKIKDKKVAHNAEKVTSIHNAIKKIIPSIKILIKSLKSIIDYYTLGKNEKVKKELLKDLASQIEKLYEKKIVKSQVLISLGDL